VQLPTWLGHVVKSGKVALFTGSEKALQIEAEDNRINLNIDSKEFAKDVMGSAGGGKNVTRSFSQLANIAKELKEDGLNYTLSYKGDRLLTIGSEARPKISYIVTRTDAVEINNLLKLLEMAI